MAAFRFFFFRFGFGIGIEATRICEMETPPLLSLEEQPSKQTERSGEFPAIQAGFIGKSASRCWLPRQSSAATSPFQSPTHGKH